MRSVEDRDYEEPGLLDVRPTDEEAPEPSNASSPRMHVRSESPASQDGRFPIPVWLHESSKSFHWRWVPLRLRKAARATAAWCRGPNPPQIQRITPFSSSIQEAPIRIIDKFLPRTVHKAGLLLFFYFCWLLTFSLVLNHSATAGYIKGFGKPSPVWCGASYWSVVHLIM